MTGESVRIGSTSCTFMSMDMFLELCERWLAGGEYHHVVTLNPEMVVAAERDTQFRAALQAADLRPPDGAGLIWARWYLRTSYWPLWPSLLAFAVQKIERVTGVDMIDGLARLCSERGVPLYFLGGKRDHVSRVADAIRRRYPGIDLYVSPEHQFDRAGPAHVLDDIKAKAPAVLLAAYGAPKQTLWLEDMRDALPSVRVAVGVGGAFDILSEKVPRAPKLVRRLNLEWLWRLYLEPRRWQRIRSAVISFPLLMRRSKSRS